ncbi:hypothetical protein P4C99_11130 [Pontiellaceae bacterium B1224]|nr:hypothetical protein [Pontiellaceae bacterium B1224]
MNEVAKSGLLSRLLNKKSKTALPKTGAVPPVQWEEVQRHLPATITQGSGAKQGMPISNPWIQSGLNGLLDAAPSLHTAANSGKYLEIIGPPEALAAGVLRQTDKHGDILGGIVDENNQILRQTRFADSANSLSAAATAAATFQVLSVATSQYYLHQINSSLRKIDLKVESLNNKMECRQLGEIQYAIATIDEIYNGNLSHIEATGMVDWQAPDRVAFWTRMANTETALRTNAAALEAEIMTALQGLSSKLKKDGKRVNVSYTAHRELLKELENLHGSHNVQHYLLALRGMVRWYQVVLSFDSLSQQVVDNGRYDAMIKYIKERAGVMESIRDEYEFILDGQKGVAGKDKAMALGKAAWKKGGVERLVIDSLYNGLRNRTSAYEETLDEGAGQFNADREKLICSLKLDSCDLFSTMAHINTMTTSLDAPQTFYLEVNEESGEAILQMASEEVSA